MYQGTPTVFTIENFLSNKFPDAVKKISSYSRFTSTKEEYDALYNGIGLRINYDANPIHLIGKDVLDFLHRVSTNELKSLKPFEKKNTLFLNEKGRLIDRTTLVSLENEYILICSSDRQKRLLSWLNKFIIMEDIRTQDVSDKYSVLEFIGQQTESFLTLLIGNLTSSLDENCVKRFDVDGFTFYLFLHKEHNGVKIFNMLIDKEKCAQFVEHLFDIKSVFDLQLVGDDAWCRFRIENQIPAFPNEINDATNPHEVNLIHEISFTKGCYIGQEVIARLDTYDKVRRKLVTVKLSENISSIEESMLYDQDKNEVGMLTSLSNPDSFEKQVALALINKKTLENSNQIFIETTNKKIALSLSERKNGK